MIRIYDLQEGGQHDLLVRINEADGSVHGQNYLADHVRSIFSRMRDKGFEPSNIMDEIWYIIEARYNSGYFRATRE
jgi:hypothetical protein